MKSCRELMDLRGRVALIAGGAGHLGVVMGEALAELGASVAVLDWEEKRCFQVACEIGERYGVRTFAIPVDLSCETEIRQVPVRVAEKLDGVDILIHSAALGGTSSLSGWATPFEEQSAETWRRALEVNLTSAFVLSQAAAPLLRKSPGASIILISSIYGMLGPDFGLYEGTSMGNPAAYGTTKGGLLQLMRYLSTVLAPVIRVNVISPGGVSRQQPESFVGRYEKKTPLGRMAIEEDFKGAALYLASDLSRYVTGHNLVVDGGWSAW